LRASNQKTLIADEPDPALLRRGRDAEIARFRFEGAAVDVLTALDAEMINREDNAHLARAFSSGRALYTYNAADYCLLHQKWITEGHLHTGIIVGAQQRYRANEELRQLMRLVSSVTAEQMPNRLEFLSSW
jgi:hypothetical protein